MGAEGDPLGIVQKLKFDHTTKLFLHKPESILDNGTHDILSDSEIPMNHLISARRPDLVITKKKKKRKRKVPAL